MTTTGLEEGVLVNLPEPTSNQRVAWDGSVTMKNLVTDLGVTKILLGAARNEYKTMLKSYFLD